MSTQFITATAAAPAVGFFHADSPQLHQRLLAEMSGCMQQLCQSDTNYQAALDRLQDAVDMLWELSVLEAGVSH
ncbi:hypothetical protein [Ottowia testudinis]|uniref:Uncharacterized protein n=1 Tax=Ottowia testudinis TaxID=2816950 RepID=A0A975CGV9_9BURK|nr:hypothetical protein [Ottowia testudinis]QTD46160.1 hypothetical protein J1M35_04440 [Ottowia testudinis]